VKPIILNYHNQYSSFQEVEEIYYEMTDYVVYKLKRNEYHACWKTTKEDMLKDRMFYNFKETKLLAIEPAFIIGPETPVLCRALRYGVAQKLEDLYTKYFSGIDQVVFKLKNSNEMMETLDEFSGFEEIKNDMDKENIALSPIKPHKAAVDSPEKAEIEFSSDNVVPRVLFKSPKKESPVKKLDTSEEIKCEHVAQDNFHLKQCLRVEKARSRINETKQKAKKEQIMLVELFELKAREANYDDMDIIGKARLQEEVEQLLVDNQEVYQNLSDYITFYNENRRIK
jgi:DNA-directed RNA polymerase beta subunit